MSASDKSIVLNISVSILDRRGTLAKSEIRLQFFSYNTIGIVFVVAVNLHIDLSQFVNYGTIL